MTNTTDFTQRLEDEVGVQPETRELFEDVVSMLDQIGDALQGDIVLDISPATVTPAPLSVAWDRNVVLTLQNAAGVTHEWMNAAFTTTLSIGDTSSAGTASIVSTTLTFVNGVATIVVSGDLADWLNTETDTLTVANITVLGVTVTGGTSVETFTTP